MESAVFSSCGRIAKCGFTDPVFTEEETEAHSLVTQVRTHAWDCLSCGLCSSHCGLSIDHLQCSQIGASLLHMVLSFLGFGRVGSVPHTHAAPPSIPWGLG